MPPLNLIGVKTCVAVKRIILLACCLLLLACSSDDSDEAPLQTVTLDLNLSTDEIQLADYLIPAADASFTMIDINFEDGIERAEPESIVNYEVDDNNNAVLSVGDDGLSYTRFPFHIAAQELDDLDDLDLYPIVAKVGETHQIAEDSFILIADLHDSFAMQTPTTTYT